MPALAAKYLAPRRVSWHQDGFRLPLARHTAPRRHIACLRSAHPFVQILVGLLWLVQCMGQAYEFGTRIGKPHRFVVSNIQSARSTIIGIGLLELAERQFQITKTSQRVGKPEITPLLREERHGFRKVFACVGDVPEAVLQVTETCQHVGMSEAISPA
jgi:hypothetical protein